MVKKQIHYFYNAGIEIPVPRPEIQEIASLSGPTSENKTDSADAIAVTLTGTIGLPTVAMVSVLICIKVSSVVVVGVVVAVVVCQQPA